MTTTQRLISLLGAVLMTLATVQLSADYAYPETPAVLLASATR